jgi:hypothetical protein
MNLCCWPLNANGYKQLCTCQNLHSSICLIQMKCKFWFQYTFTNKNLVICNHSLCDYVCLNVAYDYEWLPMWLFFKIEQILVFLSTMTCFIFPTSWFFMIFYIFTTSYIRLIAHATKIITLQSHKVCILPSSNTYKLLINT